MQDHLDIMTHICVFRGAAAEVFPLHNVELSWGSTCPARDSIFQPPCI